MKGQELKLMTVAQVARKLGIKERYLRAVRVAMGKAGARYLDPVAVRDWVLAHPEFRVHQVRGHVWTPPQSAGHQPGDAGRDDSPERHSDLLAAEQRFRESLHECSAR